METNEFQDPTPRQCAGQLLLFACKIRSSSKIWKCGWSLLTIETESCSCARPPCLAKPQAPSPIFFREVIAFLPHGAWLAARADSLLAVGAFYTTWDCELGVSLTLPLTNQPAAPRTPLEDLAPFAEVEWELPADCLREWNPPLKLFNKKNWGVRTGLCLPQPPGSPPPDRSRTAFPRSPKLAPRGALRRGPRGGPPRSS